MSFSKQENPNTIGIYNSLSVTVFIHCTTDTIVDHSLETLHDGQWFLYCLTKNGHLYRVEKGCEEHLIGQSSTSENHQSEIFSDLLRHEDTDDVFQLHMSTQTVYNLNDSDIIITTHKSPVSLCVSPSHIIVTTENSVQYMLFMYRKQHNENDDESTTVLSKSLDYFDKDSFPRSVLVQIITCDCIDSSDFSCSDVLNIDVTLFKQLFGEEIALLNSPILLLSQTDGKVCYIPLSSFVSSSSNSFISSNRSNRNKWNILCHMSDSVVGIEGLSLQKDDRQSDQYCINALCICGCDGQVVIFQSKDGKPEYSISQISIFSPVLSVRSFHNKLYYSNGSSIFESTVEFPDRDSKHFGINGQLKISDTKLVSNDSVARIHSISSDGYVKSKGSPCILYCTCQNRQVKEIKTSSWPDTITFVSPSSQHDNLKDILTSIDDVGKKRQHLKSQIKLQEENMKQLGIASYLNEWYVNQMNDMSCSKGEHFEGRNKSTKIPFSVVILPGLPVDGNNEDLEMFVEVLNQMSVTLSADWIVTVSIISSNNDDEIVTASVKINKELKVREKVILPIYIAFEQILSTCKLVVKVVLVTERNGEQHPGDNENCCKEPICVPIYEKEIDIIDCLMQATANIQITDDVSKYGSASFALVRDQAKNRKQRLKYKIYKSIEGIEDIVVCARNILHLTNSTTGKDTQDKVAQRLLETLFGKATSDNSDIKPSNFQLVTAFGHVVQLSILPLRKGGLGNLSDEDTWCREMDAFEVIVRSNPYVAAAVHRAISHREQQILQTIGNDSIKFPEVSIQLCRKAIKIAEDVMNDVSGISQDVAILSSAFQKMRSVKLR